MSPATPFEAKLASAWSPDGWQDVTVLLAVSGGADSIALLRAVHALKNQGAGKIYAAHFNHRLRGAESDADQIFVTNLCKRFDVACRVGSRDVAELADVKGDGVEAAAREARYQFLRETAQRLGARYVATAHTADDQAETILHRIVRGTGLPGLSGIAPSREFCDGISLVRPMLYVRRDEVIAYLAAIEQPYRDDESNRDLQFTRNRIREQLLPLLKKDYNPTVVEAVLRLGRLASEAQNEIDARVVELCEPAILEQTASVVRLDCAALGDCGDYLVRQLLVSIWGRQEWPQQNMSLAHWDQMAAMIHDASSAARTLPGGITALRKGEQLVLTRPE